MPSYEKSIVCKKGIKTQFFTAHEFIKREGWCMANVAFTLLRYQAKQFSSRFLFHWLCSVYMSACVIGRVLREKKMQKQVSSRGKTGIHERGLGFTSTCVKKYLKLCSKRL